MYNYYTSIVVSTLLGSPVRSNIKNIQQLADSPLDVGFEPIPFTKVYLNVSLIIVCIKSPYLIMYTELSTFWYKESGET